jgi:class 3 adenylate cyclase
LNVASRLQTLAKSGEIYISDDVFEHVKGMTEVHFESLGEQKLRNIAGSISVYRVVHSLD